jgi:hypothetical protein
MRFLSTAMSVIVAVMARKVRPAAAADLLKAMNVGRWPEIVISTSAKRRAIHDAVRRGDLRPIASRIYTPNLRDDPAQIIRRHWIQVTAAFFPNSVISDRSAAYAEMVVDGNLFLVHTGPARDLVLEGLELRARNGHGPLPSDIQFGDTDLYRASDARLLVENMLPSRSRRSIRRRLDQREVEEYLDRMLRSAGESRLRHVADEIHEVARQLGLESEGARALDLVRTFLGTDVVEAQSRVLKARVRGEPFDPDRLELFAILGRNLAGLQPVQIPADPSMQPEFPFFEAYFSNFIEGTEFGLDEAKHIVDTGEIPGNRPKDAHDVLGTYQLVSDPSVMSQIPSAASELIGLLRDRHKTLMLYRPEVRPGMFKLQNNRDGGTTFVSWDRVHGTLREGFEIGQGLLDPLARGIYLMFLISEVHPFDDGNGRIARIFLNAELYSREQQRILVPTMRRLDYLDSLRILSRQKKPELLPMVMADLQRYSSQTDWSSFDTARKQLEKDGAFAETPGSGSLAALLLRPHNS